MGFLGGSEVKASACNAGDMGLIPGFDPWVGGRYPWRRQWQPTPVLLPGESHGWRNLVGYSPWGLKESDTTERPHFHFLYLRMALQIFFSKNTFFKKIYQINYYQIIYNQKTMTNIKKFRDEVLFWSQPIDSDAFGYDCLRHLAQLLLLLRAATGISCTEADRAGPALVLNMVIGCTSAKKTNREC